MGAPPSGTGQGLFTYDVEAAFSESQMQDLGDFDGHDPIAPSIQFLGQLPLNRRVGYL